MLGNPQVLQSRVLIYLSCRTKYLTKTGYKRNAPIGRFVRWNLPDDDQSAPPVSGGSPVKKAENVDDEPETDMKGPESHGTGEDKDGGDDEVESPEKKKDPEPEENGEDKDEDGGNNEEMDNDKEGGENERVEEEKLESDSVAKEEIGHDDEEDLLKGRDSLKRSREEMEGSKGIEKEPNEESGPPHAET